MAYKPSRTCPLTGLEVPYNGFGRPNVYHPTARRKRTYDYTPEEKAILKEAKAIRRRAKEHNDKIKSAAKGYGKRTNKVKLHHVRVTD